MSEDAWTWWAYDSTDYLADNRCLRVPGGEYRGLQVFGLRGRFASRRRGFLGLIIESPVPQEVEHLADLLWELKTEPESVWLCDEPAERRGRAAGRIDCVCIPGTSREVLRREIAARFGTLRDYAVVYSLFDQPEAATSVGVTELLRSAELVAQDVDGEVVQFATASESRARALQISLERRALRGTQDDNV